MSGLRSDVEAELLEWMRREPEHEDDERFERLAGALFRHQFEHCAPFRRFCEGRGATPETVSDSAQAKTLGPDPETANATAPFAIAASRASANPGIDAARVGSAMRSFIDLRIRRTSPL